MDEEILSIERIADELRVSRDTVTLAVRLLGLPIQFNPSDRRKRGYARSLLPQIEAKIKEIARIK